MIVLDANIMVTAIIGVFAQQRLRELLSRAAPLAVPALQLEEAGFVLTEKLAFPSAIDRVKELASHIRILDPANYAAREADARARLHERAQSDWPVLAAALTFDAAIWSNDRDFFGVGVPVWSTRNIAMAAQGAL